MGLMQRLFGPKRGAAVDDAEVRTIDWASTVSTPRDEPAFAQRGGADATAVLIDSPEPAPEVAQPRPIDVPPTVVVPRNKQELMEELRKNYADVIELVRKVNSHLDDQSSRLAEQESRGRELMEIARQIPTLLATLPRLAEQNAALLGLVERLAGESAGGNEALRAAIAQQTRTTAESGAALASAITATTAGLAASVQESTEVQRRSGEALGEQLGSIRAASQAAATGFEAARAQLQVQAEDLRRAMNQHRRWSLIATVIGVVAIVATAVIAVVLLINR